MFSALYRALLMAWRMLKSSFLRPFRTLYAQFRRATSLTRQATKLVPKVVKTVTTMRVKPQQRSDYVDAGRVYIAKSLIFVIIGGVIAAWLLGQFVVWPWMESKWFTAKMYVQEERVEGYNGKVKLFADEDKTQLLFHGRLENGLKTGRGVEYHENGIESYDGEFEQDLYNGRGKVMNENGVVLYEGEFALGLYQGKGVLNTAEGVMLYDGEFEQGVYQGQGKLYENGELVYEGGFAEGLSDGIGKAYESGALVYEGGFLSGQYDGAGKTYYPNGNVRAECPSFSGGEPDGTCVLYHENGNKKYEGGVAAGELTGQGTMYDANGAKTYTGEWDAGLKSGSGVEFFADGKKKYEGTFDGGDYAGEGVLYTPDGSILYKGGFAAGGAYEGAGSLMLDNGMRVEGNFAGGALDGPAAYYIGEHKIFDGQLIDGNIEGEGVLYSGENTVYTGIFANGFVDAVSLLDLPVGDLRDAVFAGAELSESEAEQGFIIVNPALSMAVFCNYGYDEAEIVVHRVMLYGESLKSRFAGDAFVVPEGHTDLREMRDTPVLVPGVAETAQVRRSVTRYTFENYTLRLWQNADGAVDMIEWRSMTDLATGAGGAAAADSESAMVDSLMQALGLIPAAEEEGAGA